ncbi:unnamed protein product [Cunninghamella blakesleeana]
MGGFKEVKISNFQLPSDNPAGGMNVELGTVMKSPSPIGVQLGTITLQIGYDGVNLGQVSAEGVTLQKGDNNINLKGVIKPINSTADLEKVGIMFSTYVSGGAAKTSATGVSAAPDGQTQINWLTEAFKSVQLNVALSNQGGPLKIINAVSMGYLDLKFDANNAYSPLVSAPNVVADYKIPFGVSIDIVQATQNITMFTNSTGNFSQLIVPWTNTKSDQAAGKLQFAINQANLAALPGKNEAFDGYTYDLTASDLYTFGVNGLATTKAKTSIGEITLGGVMFEVPTSLHGLQFLNSTPTNINSVDMTGGTKEALQLDIGVTMGNPSDFSMSVGDVVFNMFAGSTQVGTVTLNNLTLQRGDNNVIAKANFDPKSSQDGQTMLSTFVMGKNSSASIGGFEKSTAIASLVKALSVIKIDTTLPGLKAPLIQYGNLVVPENAPQTGVVNVAVTIANPFTAGLAITAVKAAATYKGMPVGNIDQDISSNPYVIGGHATTASPQLNMNMNIEPAAVALLLRNLALDANLDTKALDGLLGMGGFHIQGQEDVAPTADVFKGFNISDYVMKAMGALKTDLQLESALVVGEYQTNLAFSQNAVQIKADNTVTRLIPIVGQPIVQQIVNEAVLAFTTLVLSDPTDNNAKVQMKGSITKTGPMDASIAFPTPLTVRWGGKQIGTATMPAIQAIADQGAQFDVPSNFVITDQKAMEEFAAYLINNEEFIWEISTDNVAVTALGFTFTNIKMQKFVTIKGCNGFKGAVKINSFDLPSNDPAGGITLIANTTINNPSQIGFSLGSAAFNAYYKDLLVGPLAASPANFAPLGPSSIQMKGRMIPQNTKHGLDLITEVFENYLGAKDSTLDVSGDSASGPTGQVGWLTNAFKTLKIEDVILPGPKEKPTLIPSITMMNMQLDFTKNPYAAPASSTEVQAQLKSPFGFPLGVAQLNMEVDAGVAGHKMAHLSIPTEKATTDASGIVKTQFSNVPFKVADDSHDLFGGFLTTLTKSANGSFGLSGSTNALATTAIGNIQLDGITFDVTTSLAGFNNFDGKVTIVSLEVTGGTKDYTQITLTVSFNNPSQITITVGDINFTAKTTDGTAIGQVFIKDTVIKPGVNQYQSDFHLAGDKVVVGKVFTAYLTNQQVPLTVVGTDKSTTIEPLKNAFQTVNLATTMQGIQADLVNHIKVDVSLGDLIAQKGQSTVTLRNPLKTDYQLTALKATALWPGKSGLITIGEINGIPGPCSVPAGGNTICNEWTVNLKANLVQLIEYVFAPNKNLNLQTQITALVGGSGGYESSFEYNPTNIPTQLNFELGAIDIPLGGLPQLLGGSSNSSSDSLSEIENMIPKDNPLAKVLFPAKATTTTTGPTSTENKDPVASATSKAGDAISKLIPGNDNNNGDKQTTEAPKATPTQDKAEPTTTTKEGFHLFPFKE